METILELFYLTELMVTLAGSLIPIPVCALYAGYLGGIPLFILDYDRVTFSPAAYSKAAF